MARKKFLRSKWRTLSKLGKGRKKKQKWRKPRGRDTQMRLQKKGNPKIVKIGYKKQKKKKELIIIRNINELLNVKEKRVILAKIGKKKKIEVLKKAKEKHIEIVNINIKKFLKKLEREEREKKERKKGKEEKGNKKEEIKKEKESKGEKK